MLQYYKSVIEAMNKEGGYISSAQNFKQLCADKKEKPTLHLLKCRQEIVGLLPRAQKGRAEGRLRQVFPQSDN